jgi:predicted RNA-binding protein with PIN domain
MAYLIDGSNFIGHTSPHEHRDPRSKRELTAKLWIFYKMKRTKVVLVFDGPPDPKISAQTFPERSLSVVFPEMDTNADTLIKEIISQQEILKKFYVVSSDREIKDYARKKGAKSLTCEEFNKQLKPVLKEHKKQRELEKHVHFPSPLEVDQWIDIFETKK